MICARPREAIGNEAGHEVNTGDRSEVTCHAEAFSLAFSNRGNAGGNPQAYDRHSPQFNPANVDEGRPVLPFDELETVFGVVVYPKADMLNQFTDFGPATGALRQEILERGRVVVFGRHAGAGIRTGRIE